MDQFQALLPEGKSVSCLDDLSVLTVKDLKKILLVYKEKLSGVKYDLVLRVYAIFTRITSVPTSSTLTTELSKEEDTPGCNDFTYSLIKAQCFNRPWTSNLSDTPPFTFIQLYDYLVIRTVKYQDILLKSTEYKKLKAFQFYYEGFIKKLEVAYTDEFCFVNVQMNASMRSKSYRVIVKLSRSSGNVCSAACTCPAGTGIGGFGNCNHVGGVLFGLEDFNRKGRKDLLSTNTSCTSKLSSWNVPRDNSSNPVPIDEVVVKKMKFGKDTEDECLPKVNVYDPRFASDRTIDNDKLSELKSSLHSSLSESCFFLFHDMDPYPPQGEIQEITEEIVNLESLCPDNDCDYSTSIPSIPSEGTAFNYVYDISSQKFKSMMDYYHSKSGALSHEQINQIEIETRKQSSSTKWFEHRKYRITASNFYSAARNNVEPSCKLKSMFYASFSTTGTRHGIDNETHVLNLYRQFLQTNNIDADVHNVGFIISYSHSFLGASLDAIVTDNATGEKWGVEIKCPSSKFGQSLHNIVQNDKTFFLQKKGEQIVLNRSHKYFYQVQGQMFCADILRVDFVVWFGDDEPLYTETIFFDELFWSSKVLPRLDFFYRRAVLPEYFTKRVADGKKLYLHGGWVNHEEK